MKSVMTSLNSILTMRHCTVAPLSSVVTFRIVMMEGFGPSALSGDVILSYVAFRDCPKKSITEVGRPVSAVMSHTSSPDFVALSQENVKSSPEHALSLTRRRVTEEEGIIL